MNERIKELAEQAGLQQRVWNSLGKELPMWQEDPDNPGLEKFAELIVKECIERGNDLAKHYINNHSEQRQVFLLAAIADYSNEIEKHFGVEK